MARFAAIVAYAAAVMVAGAAAQGGVGSIITEEVYNSMLPNRDNPLCDSGFFTYAAFIEAANSFQDKGFGVTGGDAMARRELAAFFGQTSQETNGGTAGRADQFEWGYCFKEEKDKTDPPFYGRGPIQLTHQSNYQLAGDAIGEDLVGNPDLVATDPVVSFKTAMWFWTTAQDNKPSCHDVILGQWTPTAADTAAGRVPGYGVITNIINGGVECGKGVDQKGENRIGYYKRYCGMLGVDAGDNLDCYTQGNFAS